MSWRLPLEAVTITIANPDEPPQLVNATDAVTATDGTQLSAVQELSWQWSRPSPRDHQDDGTLELTLRFALPRHIAIDAYINIALHVAGHIIDLPGHWVESVTWAETRRPDLPSVWTYTITATNGVGRANGIRLSATPWPEHDELEERLDRINAASPVPLVDLEATATNLGGPSLQSPPLLGRDVDSANALDIITRTANTWGLLIAAVRRGVALYSQEATRIFGPANYSVGTRWSIVRTPPPTPLPASAIEQRPRSLSRQGLVTTCRVDFYVKNSTTGEVREASRTWRASVARPSAQVNIATDYLANESTDWPLDDTTAFVGDVAQTAIALVVEASTNPAPILEEGRIVLARVPELLPALIAPVLSQRTQFIITDAPDDLAVAVAITQGHLTVADGQVALSLALQPLALTGTRPMRISDWPGPEDLPDVADMGNYVPAQFLDLDAANALDQQDPGITIADTALVFRPQYWKE